MKTYPVLSTLSDGKRRYLPGDTVELDEDQANRLQQIGVVGEAATDSVLETESVLETATVSNPKSKPRAKK